MRVWCAHCKRAQEVHIPRSRRRRVMEALAGRIGVCAICGYPVSAIGTAMSQAQRFMSEPSIGMSRVLAQRGAA